MNSATVKNHYQGIEKASIFSVSSTGHLSLNSGSVLTHNASAQNRTILTIAAPGTLEINPGSLISYNHADAATAVNGGLFWISSDAVINGGEFCYNTFAGDSGNLFIIHNSSSSVEATLTMNGGWMHHNASLGDAGYLIYIHKEGGGGKFYMYDGLIEENRAVWVSAIGSNGSGKNGMYLMGGTLNQIDSSKDHSGYWRALHNEIGENMTINGGSLHVRRPLINNGTLNTDLYLQMRDTAYPVIVSGSGVVTGDLYVLPYAANPSTEVIIQSGTYLGNLIVSNSDCLSISGGLFKNDPSAYLADSYEAVYDEASGFYTVKKYYEASFGGVNYVTLEEAIAAANTAGGGTVTLIHDVDLDSSITLSSDILFEGAYSVVRSDSYTGNLFTVDADCTLTLDGGITVDGGNEWVLDYDALYTKMMSSPSSVSSLTLVTPEDNAPVATDYMFKVNGNVILNNAVVQNNYGKVLTSVFSVASGANVTLNSGAKVTHNASINVENENKFNASVAYVAKGGVLVMNDGADISYNHMVGDNATLAYLHGDFIVNGGDIHNNSSINCGGLVVILDTTGVFTVNDGHIHENTNLVKNGANAAGAIFVYGTSKFIMNGGLIEKNYSSGTTVIYAYSASSVELNGGTIRQEQRATHSGYSSYIAGTFTMGEDMTIEGGSIQIQKPFSGNATFDCDVWLGGTSTVSNGTFNHDLRAVVSTTISGGTFLGNITVDSEKTLSIKGGRFKNDPSAYLADYYEAVYDEVTGFYIVNKYYEASFGGVNYDSLEEAIAAANTAGGGTVTLLHDVDLDSSITVSSDILLEGAYSVVRSDSYTGNLFTVDADCTLTLDGGITIDGGNNWTIDMDALNACMAANGANLSSTKFATAEEGAPKANAYAFNINGHLVMNSATVKNHYASTDSASVFYIAGGASLTMNSGAVATHNASDKNRAVVYCAANGDWIINEGAEISYNHGGGNGATSWISGRLTMNGGEVHHNTQKDGAGVFVIVYGGGLFTMNGGSIYENASAVSTGTVAGIIYVYDGTKFVMNGGVIEKNYSNGNTGIYAKAATSSLELNAGIIRQELRATAPTGYTGLASGPTYIGEDMLIEGGVFRFSKGDFVMNGTMICDVQIRKFSGEIDINGTIDGDVSIDGSITTTISGGNWLGQFVVAEGSALSITGGLYKNDPSAYLADYYEAVYDESSGFYTVNKYYEASFDGVNYDSLEEAIAAANTAGGGTVTLLHDVDLDSSITVSSDVLLEGAYSVVRSNSYTGNLFTVAADCTLTLDGGITVDGGNEWTIDYELLNECMLANGSTSVATSFVTPEAGAPVATDYMFNISGSVIMNNAIVKNNYQTTGEASPFYVASGATLTMNDGAVATHNCSFGGNSVARISSGAEWAINEGAEVSYNHAEGGNGGVAYVNGHVIMNGGEVHHNTLYTGAGSFLILHSGGKLTMNDGSIHDNTNVIIGNVVSATIYVHGNGTFIMNGGVIEKNKCNRTSTIYAYASTSVVELNAGIIRHEDNTVTSAASSYFAGRTVIGEDVVIDGGIIRFYKVTDYKVDGQLNCELQLARTTADLNIGGTLNGRLLVYDSSNITVTGGTYLGGFKIYSGVTFEIEGGSFRENPTDWTAEGYHPVYSKETELYTVILTPVASIGGTKYDTLVEAVAAAEDGDVINIIASHKLADSVTIDKAVTVDLKNQTITLSPAAAVAFVIEAETTFCGEGTVNTDNGNSSVFTVGSDSTAGSLTIENGSYVGESTVASVKNGSVVINGGNFEVNPDVAEGETPDTSLLLDINQSSAEGATANIAVRGGTFRGFNPKNNSSEGQNTSYVEDAYDSVEKSEDYYTVTTHSFGEYVYDGNATCTEDGTKTAKCVNCETTHTVTAEGTALEHSFTHFVSDGNATCTENGTETAKCDRCDATYTVTDKNSELGHSFTNYKSNGDATCEENGTKTAKCDRCDEERTIMDGGTKLKHTYSGVTCTECGTPRIWLIVLIVFAVLAFLSFGMLLVV